jgi:hypothetical protein
MAGNYHGRYRYKIIYLIGRGLAFLSDRTQVGTSEKIYEDLYRKPSSTMLRSKPFCCNVLEVDDLIFQLTRGKHSIYTPGI